MSEILVEVTRGELVESLHRGDVVVVNHKGEILYYAGDPHKVTYFRSSAKPIQTMNVILSGAAERFHFTEAELSIMCASHYGEDFHRNTVENILEKIGLGIPQLLCGTATSARREYAMELAAKGAILNPTYTDCSGKHAGMLATCIHKGYPIETYCEVDHPVQKEVITLIANVCKIDKEEIKIGIDGCNVPVFGMPLYNMALGFARLANPEELSEEYQMAANKVFEAMNCHPEMIAGTEGFCTELMKHSHGKLVGKLGAEGVYAIGIKGKNLGIAVKMEDGDLQRSISPTVMQCLRELNILEPEEMEALASFEKKKVYNHVKSVVGEVRAAYHLTKA